MNDINLDVLCGSDILENGLSVSLEKCCDFSDLEKIWRQLEEECRPPFFLSWLWISTWLESIKPNATVATIRNQDRVVGLGLLVFKTQKIAKFFTSHVFYLHQTGDLQEDQIWPEYNAFMVLPEFSGHAEKAALLHLKNSSIPLDELRMGASLERTAELYSTAFDARHDFWTSPAYGVDLDAVRASGGSYLASLSRNTRHQINRSFRRYEEDGRTLSLQFAQTKEQALALFKDMGPLHIERWGDKLGESGFVNEKFVGFHAQLISNGWAAGAIDLVCLKAGNEPIGYFYNLRSADTIYFYMSGLVREKDAKLKPGLCGHSLLVDHYLAQDFAYYDFMGGNERYKQSLGAQHGVLYQSSFRWARSFFTLEDNLRRIKKWLEGSREKRSKSS